MANPLQLIIAVLVATTAATLIWSLFKYQTTYVAVIDLLPQQFRDGLSSRYAFPEYVLNPSTPLVLQADYVKSQTGFCFATLGISLLCFLFQKTVVAWIILVMFLGFSALAVKSYRAYKINCNR